VSWEYRLTVIPNTHRRRDATFELSLVGVGGAYWALRANRVFNFLATVGGLGVSSHAADHSEPPFRDDSPQRIIAGTVGDE